MAKTRNPAEPKSAIAVVGLACRLPGAASPAELWSLLKAGTDAVAEIPPDRWDVNGFFHPDPNRPGKMYTRAGGFIADIDKFDAGFFGISPREARRIDPQQRILLELTWEALEDAGIVPARLAGSQTGVFVGISVSDYAALERDEPDSVDAYVMSGSALSNAANRISYIFDLHGPSFAIDTACSSSLVAVHQACVSLRRGESRTAIVGGINVLLSPSGTVGFSKAHMLSPTGRCRPFDAAGDGYVRSEGGGVFVLKPLAEALAEGNRVHAVIVGSGVNSDGRTSGLAMPNQAAQAALLCDVYRDAGIDPAEIDYVEAHGTGTGVGDPIECGALGEVIGGSRAEGDCCRIGSIKSNVGHLEPASGVAGLLKVILALRHRAVPGTLHFKNPNPQIAFDALNLSVVSDYTELGPDPLTMGVNSFGFGGTNAHVVVREFIPSNKIDEKMPAGSGMWPLLISARSPEAVAELASRYADLLRSPEAPNLPELARAAAVMRTHHPLRLAAFARNRGELAGRLEAFAGGGDPALVVEGQALSSPARLAFTFSGNGSQWFGMGRDLLADSLAGEWIARVDAALRPFIDWSVAEVLASDGSKKMYERTEIAQPALFALQVAVFEWLRAHGVEAGAMVGHSVGEVAAAYAAGALTLAAACRVIAERSRAQAPTAGAGRMAALGLSEEDAASAIAPYGEGLTIAAVNGPNSVTVAGEAPAIEALGAELAGGSVFFRALDLDYAFHSRAMDPIRAGLIERLDGLGPREGHARFISTVAGGVIDGGRLGAEYWWDNIRKPVRFAAAIGALAADGYNIFLEIGPHAVLDGYVRECLRGSGGEGVAIPTLRREAPERDALWLALGRCYAAGVTLDYDALYPVADVVVPLPTYPWQRERFWFRGDEAAGSAPWRKHPLLGKRLSTTDGIWQNRLDPVFVAWLGDHVLQGSVVLPGTGFIEMALAAVAANGGDAVEIEGLEIRRPMVFADGGEAAIEIALAAEDGSFRVSGGADGGAAHPPFAVGRAVALPQGKRPPTLAVDELRSLLPRHTDGAAIYRRFAVRGLDYRPSFRGIAETWATEGEALGRIVAPASVAAEPGEYLVHPALLDACLQVALAATPEETDIPGLVFIPTKAARIRFHGGGAAIAWSHVKIVQMGVRSIVADYGVLDAAGEVILEIGGLRLSRVDFGVSGEIPAYHWRYQEQPSASAAPTAVDLPNPASLLGAGETREAPPGEARAALERVAAAYARQALATVATAALERAVYRAALQGLTGADRADPSQLWRDAVSRHPAHLAALQLVARWGEALPAILRGEVDPRDLDGAGQGFDAKEQLYDSDPIFRGAKDAAIAVTRRLFETVPATRPLRILEIGGGTGWLAAAVLQSAPRDRIDYVLTDPDAAAVGRAEVRFAGMPCVRCGVLDPGRRLDEQGFSAADYDFVIAGAVPGGAAVEARELAVLRDLLKPGGLLLLVAASPGGLLELAIGEAPGSGTGAADWHEAFGDAGFTDISVRAHGDTLAPGQLAVARKPAEARASFAEVEPATWLVLADDPTDKLSAATIAGLAERGQRVTVAAGGGRFERLGLDRFVAPGGDRGGYDRLFGLLAVGEAGPLHVLHLRAASAPEPADPLSPQRDGSFDLLVIVQALVGAGLAASWRLSAVTRGAMPGRGASGGCRHPWQAPLWGVMRTALAERPDLLGRLIDLDPGMPVAAAAEALVGELLHGDAEDEVLLHGGTRLVPRLMPGMPLEARRCAAPEAAFTLSSGTGESRDEAVFREIGIPLPAAGEVTVKVHAAGLNFRDVLQRIGLLPQEAFEGGFAGPTLGMEFAGEIVAVGDGVDGFAPGDAVFGFGRDAFSSHIATPAFGLFKKPAAMSCAEAATLPVAAVTVYYSLHHVARLQPGERILIHGAAGGVGIAAIQYSQSVGAEIFASAGSPEKRDFLRRLGIRHIVDSRSLAFADEIREITDGEGIDVVLNSIAGEAIHKGLSILRAYGRFIELGKRDFYANSKLGLQPFSNNIQFSGVDVDRLLVDRPALARQVFAELTPLIDGHVFAPLPYRVFPAARAVEAFRCMQHSRHIGKIVLALSGADHPAVIDARPEPGLGLSADATYLVSGGRGGFGLATAEWLARAGARHLALVGRSTATGPGVAMALERLRGDGVEIRELTADVADEAQVKTLLDRLGRDMPALRGIVHCAAVIEDASLVNMTEENFYRVLRPKISGAWNLHRQTLDRDLQFFVMYSSATALFGNEGQANYVAANLYLEALAAHRRGLGLPALAVAWGAIGEVGHLAQNPTVARLLSERLGVRALPPRRALDRLGQAMQGDAWQVALAEIGWSRLAKVPSIARSPKYAPVREIVGDGAGEAAAGNIEELRVELAALPRDEAMALVQQLLIKHIAGVLGVAPAKLGIDKSLLDLGMDSLMLVETQMGLEKQFGVAILTMELMDMTTVAKLARRVVSGLGIAPAAEIGTTVPDADEAAATPAASDAMERILENALDRAREAGP